MANKGVMLSSPTQEEVLFVLREAEKVFRTTSDPSRDEIELSMQIEMQFKVGVILNLRTSDFIKGFDALGGDVQRTIFEKMIKSNSVRRNQAYEVLSEMLRQRSEPNVTAVVLPEQKKGQCDHTENIYPIGSPYTPYTSCLVSYLANTASYLQNSSEEGAVPESVTKAISKLMLDISDLSLSKNIPEMKLCEKDHRDEFLGLWMFHSSCFQDISYYRFFTQLLRLCKVEPSLEKMINRVNSVRDYFASLIDKKISSM